MARYSRKTQGRTELDALWQGVASLNLLVGFSTFDAGGITDGTTAGKLKTVNTVSYRVAGVSASKSATDDLWDLSGETDTAAGTYTAYWLYLNAAGTASFAAGTAASSAALALAALPAVTTTKSVIGVFVAGPATDWDDAGGLAAQGTIYDGIPDGVPTGVPGVSYDKPDTYDVDYF